MSLMALVTICAVMGGLASVVLMPRATMRGGFGVALLSGFGVVVIAGFIASLSLWLLVGLVGEEDATATFATWIQSAQALDWAIFALHLGLAVVLSLSLRKGRR
ncbi:hypothetical protein ILP92_06160 [Maribius pontilimi]|uniref:Uncharacterized protein n=1 Tax=Palleronia pontilimi TaxID=1964209 RepID=A0A934I8L4_9RHOB|nr:hypothetical protein [Palleronia pontilimi]MBJ3762323.1 hypothetical protein [Palleronia pontilimi]